MNKTYIVLLKNNYLLFFSELPKKQGNYLKDVKIFKTNSNTSCEEICKWISDKYQSPKIKEIENWE
ncbi:hypothetical protein ACFL2K_02745 [Candidatus Margulisiibacteriota bacterium]